MGFMGGHQANQGHQPHYYDNEEEDNQVQDFCEDVKDIKGIYLTMMMTTPMRTRTRTRTTTMTRVFQLWDQIETWSFREDIKVISLDDDNNNKDDKDDDNNKGNNDSMGI